MIKNLFKYRKYVFGSFWTDLRYRYAGTALGFFWFIVTPLLEVMIYTAIFSQLIQIRSGGGRDISYVIFLISGLFPFLALSQIITRGSNAIKANAVYIRRSTIPAEIFVFKEAMHASFSLLIYMFFLIPVILITKSTLTWHILLWPVFSIFLSILGYALSLPLANLRILLPDLGEIIPVVLQLWRWTLPIMFSDASFPPKIAFFMKINPPYYFIKAFREILIEHVVPSPKIWLIIFFWLIVTTFIAGWVNKVLRPEVKDSL